MVAQLEQVFLAGYKIRRLFRALTSREENIGSGLGAYHIEADACGEVAISDIDSRSSRTAMLCRSGDEQRVFALSRLADSVFERLCVRSIQLVRRSVCTLYT